MVSLKDVKILGKSSSELEPLELRIWTRGKSQGTRLLILEFLPMLFLNVFFALSRMVPLAFSCVRTLH